MSLSDQSVHENVGRIILHVLISSHHTGWCFLKAQMRHDTHALAQTMHIHATSIRITHADRSSKSRRSDPLERPNRPSRGPMHPPQRARHGGCRRRGPCHMQWPQRHDNDRLAAAIDLCVDPCGWRRRRSSSACTAAETPPKRSWHLPGMWGNALRQWEGRGGARLAVVRKFGPDHGAEASGRKARLWVEGRLQGGPRTSRVAKEVSEVAKTMGKSNAVEESTCEGRQGSAKAAPVLTPSG